MRSPLGDPVRSESVAGMDMLNDMFQRQARRLEAQLYQRAQDQRTIEVTQRQAQIARAQVRRLEQTHCEQAARILQGAKSLQQLQQLIRETLHVKQEVLGVCDELEREVAALREALGRVAPGEAEKLPRRRAGSASDSTYSVEALRQRAGGDGAGFQRLSQLRNKSRMLRFSSPGFLPIGASLPPTLLTPPPRPYSP